MAKAKMCEKKIPLDFRLYRPPLRNTLRNMSPPRPRRGRLDPAKQPWTTPGQEGQMRSIVILIGLAVVLTFGAITLGQPKKAQCALCAIGATCGMQAHCGNGCICLQTDPMKFGICAAID